MMPIAVTGIDCRFPGAIDKDAYWRLMMDGSVNDTEVPQQRWDVNAFYSPDGGPGTTNTRRGHFIDDIDAFDHEFFGIAPVEAAALDPQQRLLLQSSWRALEDATIDPRSLAGTSTGVFVGVMSSEWSTLQLLDYAEISPFRGSGSGYFMTANRISYHLGLTGPSVAIDSACSSSLTAIHQGCAALRSGEADTVIAGGVNLILTPALSIFYTQAGLSAPDGRCKPFQHNANGIGRGEGVATVVLRRLDDALADRQPIYAVVRSSVTNHDGRSNGITAPNRRSQAELMRRALDLATVTADQIAFVEAHGTGTVLGDRIEANALGDLHENRTGQRCLLGSVKGNIGHTEGSAGIAAFIKTCLALHHRVLPPSVLSDGPNPDLHLQQHGLRLADEAEELSQGAVFGAVSSFGLGGSNAHAILESAPVAALPMPGRRGVLTISAPSARALTRNIEMIADSLHAVDDNGIAAWCRSSNVVKRSHRHRVVLQGDSDGLLDGISQFAAGRRADLLSSMPSRRGLATAGLLFTGQGGQYSNMTRPLYDANPVYRQNLDTVAAAVTRQMGRDLLGVTFGGDPRLNHTSLAQPALFAVSYALGKTLLQTGIRPTFGVGHSLGEITAACLAGVLTVDDAARLVVARGRLMGSLPPGGGMIAIDLDLELAETLVAEEPGCSIAAVNGPNALTISGRSDAVMRLGKLVRGRGGKVVDLAVSHAFHSPLMEPIIGEFQQELDWLEPQSAQFALFSTALGRRVDGREMTAEYWAQQLVSPVRFYDALVAAVRTAGADYLVEAGPRTELLTLARKSGAASATTPLLAMCSGPNSMGSELLEVGAKLMRDGFSPELTPLYGAPEEPLPRIAPYVFDDAARFWFGGDIAPPRHHPQASQVDVTPAGSAEAEVVRVQHNSEEEILALIADVGNYPVSTLARSQRLADDLGYDSLLQLRLLDRLRAQYPQLQHVNVVDVLPNIGNVGGLVDFVAHELKRFA